VTGPIAAFRGWLADVAPRRRFLEADIIAGVPNAVSNVPDGMASGVLAGVSPVAGLYASFAGPVADSHEHPADGHRHDQRRRPRGRVRDLGRRVA
jgi:hypothetical protein